MPPASDLCITIRIGFRVSLTIRRYDEKILFAMIQQRKSQVFMISSCTIALVAVCMYKTSCFEESTLYKKYSSASGTTAT